MIFIELEFKRNR